MPGQQLPDIKLDPEVEKAIAIWLDTQITNVKLGRSDMEKKWSEIRKYFLRTEIPEKKDYPWPGAANVMMPVMATFCMELFARIKRTLSSPSLPFAVAPSRDDYAGFINPLRKYLKWLAEEGLELWNVMDPMILELLKLGTCVSKTIYVEEKRMIHVYDEGQQKWISMLDIVESGTAVIFIPLVDHFFPVHLRDYSKAPWKSHRFRATWNELKIGVSNGKYRAESVEHIKAWYTNNPTDAEQDVDAELGLHPVELEEFEIHEVWFEYAVKDPDNVKNVATRLVGYLHPESYTFLRLQYNWYPLQLDPFDLCVYEHLENYIYGVGPGEMSLPFQKEVSIMHCQRLDNATVVNAQAFLVQNDELGNLNITIRPGAKIPVDDVDKSVKALTVGSKYDSTIQEEEHTLGFLKQRIGLNAPMPTNMGSATATATMSMMQEALGRFDAVIERVRAFMKSINEKVLLLEGKYRPEGHFLQVLGERDGMAVAALLARPPREILDGIGLSVTATTAATSKEVERQAKLGLFGVLTNYYDRILQLFIQAFNPQMPPPMQAVLIGLAESLSTYLRDILEGFDVHNKAELLFGIERLNQLASQFAGQAPVPGPNGAAGMGGMEAGVGEGTGGGGQETQAGY